MHLLNSAFIAGPRNGEINPVGNWPWMASLGKTNDVNKSWTHLCGATLISDRHFLTAAHCIVDKSLSLWCFKCQLRFKITKQDAYISCKY